MEKKFVPARNLKAVIHCSELIPCNPCETACRYKAISVGEPIINIPQLDESKCKGCGICVAVCPGLAISMIQHDYAPGKAVVVFPFEYLPLPEIGQRVGVVNWEGKKIGMGQVLKILQPLKDDPTKLIQVIVSQEIAKDVRGIERRC